MSLKKCDPKKVSLPDYVGKVFTCPICGGKFQVRKNTSVMVMTNSDGSESVTVTCPHCGKRGLSLKCDPHAGFRKVLIAFIMSQVDPIKAIKDEDVRLPMQRLLDDFNRLVQEYE